jgi:hypothetical protein
MLRTDLVNKEFDEMFKTIDYVFLGVLGLIYCVAAWHIFSLVGSILSYVALVLIMIRINPRLRRYLILPSVKMLVNEGNEVQLV